MKAKNLRLALDAERKIVRRLIRHPEEFDKMPKKSIVIPKLDIEVPVKSWRSADSTRILSRLGEPKFMRELHAIRRNTSKMSGEELLEKLKNRKSI